MKEWEIRQKHYQDIRAAHQKLGHLDSRGEIRRFDGRLFFPEIQKSGHTGGELESCRCWLERFSYQRFAPVRR